MTENRLHDLPRDECLRLIETVPIGRVVYTDRALPVCTPVNFRVHRTAIVFRTAPASRLAAAVDGAVVAFEVDRFDSDGRAGWSVLVTGTATHVEDVGTLLRLEQLGVAPAAGDDRSRWIRIMPAEVAGRRVVARADEAAHAVPLAG